MDYTELKNKLVSCQEKAEKALTEYLSASYAGETMVADAMRYSTLDGGKRIRAFLALEFCRMFGGKDEAALPFAAAIECIHAYSLIHDDLPCMDDDDLRRGKPSCHKKFGEAEALLAGDALLTAAFDIMASNEYVKPENVVRAVRFFAHEAGACGMVGGQVLDIADEVSSYDDLITIYYKKTSCLILSACMLGYLASGCEIKEDDVERIKTYAGNIGIAFQIHDDILDVISDTETLGKTVGSDEKNGKKTVLAFMTLEEAGEEEKRLTAQAVEAVGVYGNSDVIVDLANWLITRNK